MRSKRSSDCEMRACSAAYIVQKVRLVMFLPQLPREEFMQRYPAYVLLLASGLLLGAGCSRTDNRVNSQGEAAREATPAKTTGTAFVRYVSAIEAHNNTDLYFGDMRLFTTSGAEKPTGYKEVPAERRDFILRQADQPDGMEIEK